MDVETAKQAGVIANQIAVRDDAIELLKRAIAGKWSVCALRANSPDGANDVSLILGPLDETISAQAFGFALQIYQAQRDEMAATLAEM